MTDVKRYKKHGEILGRVLVPARNGDCVRHSDYAALEDRLEAVTEERNVQNDLRQIAEDAADDYKAQLATARRDALEEAVEAAWEADSLELANYGVTIIIDRIRALAQEDPTPN